MRSLAALGGLILLGAAAWALIIGAVYLVATAVQLIA